MPVYKTWATSVITAGALCATPALGTDCTCKNGTPDSGPDCHDLNLSIEKCKTCDAGFFMTSGDSCGRCPVTATRFQIPDAADPTNCIPCGPTQELNAVGDACVDVACTCANGTPLAAAGDVCYNELAGLPGVTSPLKIGAISREYCASCDDGYDLVDGKCKLVECNCVHGTPVDGGVTCSTKRDAASGQLSFCASCHPTYELNIAKTECVPKAAPSYSCYCDNGTPMVGAMCYENGHAAHICETCDEGFGIGGWPDKDGKCIRQTVKSCTCLGGTRATGDWCTHNGGDEVCVECKSPLILTWSGECKPKKEIKCTCKTGFTVDTKSCLTRGGGEACARCGGNFGDLTKAANADGTHEPFVGGICDKQETTAIQLEVVDIAFLIPNMDFVMLKEHTPAGVLLGKVEIAIKDAILEMIGNEWKREDFKVTMAAGSTIVNARMTMPTNTAAKNLATLVKSHAFKVALAEKLNALDLGPILTGPGAQVGTVGVKFATQPPAMQLPVQQPPAKVLPVQQPPAKVLPVQRPPAVVLPQQPAVKPIMIPAKPLNNDQESMPANIARANAANAVACALGGNCQAEYEVKTPLTTSTTNFPLLGAVAAAFFAGGLFIARALPRGRGFAPVEQSLMEHGDEA